LAKSKVLIVLVVIDTNILLISISSKSKYHWLYRLILDQKVEVACTNDILIEYEEQIARHWHPQVAWNVIRSLVELPTVTSITIHYNLRLIESDADDNKFVDCAFAANADYIITNDNHFNVLKSIEFPSIPILRIEEFKALLTESKII
jgi:putative PIN family toxin of toxin-antitoxin system